MRYVYGPIASRRLGRSLGVSLIESKTCPLDCLYCEAGPTTLHTLERKEYVKLEDVLQELDQVLSTRPELDFITFSGPGEPTLNSRFGEAAEYIKKNHPRYRLCLLTNGCLFDAPGMLDELRYLDLIIPSLDGSDEEEFAKLNQPVAELGFERFLNGMRNFCEKSTAHKVLELFIAPGINDSAESIKRFAEIIATLKVDKVQLNSLDRPGIVDYLKPVEREKLNEFIHAIEPIVPVEAVGRHQYRTPGTITSAEYFKNRRIDNK